MHINDQVRVAVWIESWEQAWQVVSEQVTRNTTTPTWAQMWTQTEPPIKSQISQPVVNQFKQDHMHVDT